MRCRRSKLGDVSSRQSAPIPVPSTLRHWVASIHTMSLAPTGGVLIRPPDASTTLVFRVTSDRRSDVTVLGPRTRASYYGADKDIPFALRARVRAGYGCAILGLSADELVDRAMPLDELWGVPGRQLSRVLSAAGEDPGRLLKCIERALAARVAALTARDAAQLRLVHAAAGELGNAHVRVRDVAARLGMSERHLRTVFRRAVGVSPKRFSRIQRVRSVLAHRDPGDLARLAADAGYYDQSHLTAEFRATMGVTPRAFLAGGRPAPSGC